MNDIFEEVTRQMNSLKRQASKAERYAKLREEMRAKLRLVLASKFAQLEQESAALDAQISTISEEMRQQAENVQQSESEHAERTQRGYAIETEVRENRERLSQLKLESDRALAQRRHNEERCAELVARIASSEAELAQAQQRLAALAAERDANRQILDSAAGDLAAAQQELAQSQQEATAAAAALAELERQQEQSRVTIRGSRGRSLRLAQPASPRSKSAWPESIARPNVCRRKWPRQTLRWKPSEDSVAS